MQVAMLVLFLVCQIWTDNYCIFMQFKRVAQVLHI